MIVRATDGGSLLISQPDHAALAATIIEAWRSDGLPESSRRGTVLLATREHDNGWREEDAQPLVGPDGHLLDFISAPTAIRQRIWPRAVERLHATPYAAALVAEHAMRVFERYQPDPGWQTFFRTLESLRNDCLSTARGTLTDLCHDYFFVRIGDLASLIFCNGWKTPDRAGRYTLGLLGGRLTIAPDPFDGREILLTVSARMMPGRLFRSREEAVDAFARAPLVTIDGVASGPA